MIVRGRGFGKSQLFMNELERRAEEGVQMIRLKDTIVLMESTDYKDRFKAEYCQLEIRYRKLAEMIKRYEAGTLDFEPKCNILLLKEQRDLMGKYLGVLELRAEIEGVELY